MLAICSTGVPPSKLVESNVPTLRIGRLGERTVVASALIAAPFGCVCCIMLVSDATELAASLSGLMHADDDIPGHAGCRASHDSEPAPGRHAAPQLARVHANCRMMQQLQLRSFSAGSPACAAASACHDGVSRSPGRAPPGRA